jgi:hypothetical protein
MSSSDEYFCQQREDEAWSAYTYPRRKPDQRGHVVCEIDSGRWFSYCRVHHEYHVHWLWKILEWPILFFFPQQNIPMRILLKSI